MQSGRRRLVVLLLMVALLTSTFTGLVRPIHSLAAGEPSILVIVDPASSNPLSGYVTEILAAEGFDDVEVRPIADLTAALLTGRRVVILGESAPSSAQISALDSYVSAGGGLIAMRPVAGLNTTLGLTSAAGTTAEGYLRITDNTIGAGLYSNTMQFHGSATHYALQAGTTQVAELYTTRTSATGRPAVTIASRGSGRAAMFAYDLGRSVALTRQGNPANADVDTDGDGVIRSVDIYRNWTDLERSAVPQADVQGRLLSRLIEAVSAQPMPRLWFFPGTASTVLIATADAHANPDSYYQTEIDQLSQHNTTATFYLTQSSAPSAANVADWRSQGYDFSIHPYVDCGYACGIDATTNWLGTTYGITPRTSRTHQVRWTGWSEAAAIEASRGLLMDFNSYQWGTWLTNSSGPALGYLNGGGLPMRFVEANGNILPIYQQHTSLVDEFLAPNAGLSGLTLQQAVAASRATIDDAINNYHVPVATQFHVDYFFPQNSDWALQTADYALSRGAVSMHAHEWLDFVLERAATTFSNSSWSSNTLTFTVDAGGNGQRLLLPLQHRGNSLTGVTIDGTAATYTTLSINGAAYAAVTVSSGTYSATYQPDTTAPQVSTFSPASGTTDVPLTSPVTVTFSEVMQRLTAQGAFSISPNVAGAFSWNSAGTVMTFTPSSLLAASTQYTVSVSTAATDLAGNPLAAAANWSFTTEAVTPPPTVTGVSPISGPIAGGTVVTISGSDFTGATAVRFGNVNAASFTVVSDSQITATSPAHAAGAVHVSVTTPAGTSPLVTADQFTFVDASSTLAILSVDPGTGSSAGGTSITVTGSSFQTGATVTIGGDAASNVTVLTTTRLTAVVPPHAPGVVNVIVSNPGGQSATLTNAFTYVNCSAFCEAQSSTADFSSGTAGANTTITTTTDGEVMLAPTVGAEFAGSTLPAGWTATPWSAGGAATVGGGELIIDGALVVGGNFVTPGRSIEFVGTFNSVAHQHAGLGTDLNNAPWAIFSTGSSGGALYARTNSGTSAPIDTQLTGSWLGAPHRFRIDWTSTTITYWIDGIQVAQHNVALLGDMRPVLSDGSVGGAGLTLDWLRLGPYAASGSFTSNVIDAGGTASWGIAAWSADLPAGANLSVSVRTGNSPTPDATWSAFTALSGSGASVGASSRYLQYRVDLATSAPDTSPVFRDITFAFSISGSLFPVVSSVTPSTGTTDGGTTVTISGRNYAAGATVAIGGVAATNVTVVNSTTITATTAAHAAGTVDVVVTNPDGGSGIRPASYTYVQPPPTVTAIQPASGSKFGGTRITITGTHFENVSAVAFGGTPAAFTVTSPTQIVAFSPAHDEGAVSVRVTTVGGTSTSTAADQFTYLNLPPPPIVTAVDPGVGTTAGGTSVIISGANFGSGATVTFDGTAASSSTVIDSTRIQVTTPAHAVGSVDIVVTNTDGQSALLASGYRYISCLATCVTDTAASAFDAGTHTGTATSETADGEVTLTPTAGAEFAETTLPSGWSADPWSAGGGATVANGAVTVDGALLGTDASFSNGRILEFVGTFQPSVPFQHAGFGTDLNSTPWAIFSTGSDGAALYVRTNAGGSFATTALSASFLGAPHRFRIEWTSASVTYSIDGAVVASHDVAITQNMRPVASDGAVGGESLVIDWMRLSPYATSGSFDSRVIDSAGNATWDAATWSAHLPAGTGMTVSVRTGNTPVPDGTWSAYTVLSASGASIGATARYAQYRVEMTTSDSGSTPAFRDITLTYSTSGAALPSVTDVAPNSGSVDGGTAVTISGANFAAGATVQFGGTAATNVTVVNATTITATTPAHAAGAVDVVVTNPDGGSGMLPAGFTYLTPPPVVTAISPTAGPVTGGTVVTITGTHLAGATQVRFGTAPASTFTVVSPTRIDATAPAQAAGTVDITVTTPSGTSATSPADRFTYQELPPAPVVTAIDPAIGTIAGGTNVTVAGTNFVTGASVTIGGSAATAVTVVNSTRITATAPAHTAGVVDVVVRNPDNQTGALTGGFTYVACGGGCLGDTTSDNFSAGTHNGTTTTETVDGEVTLAPAAGAEFSGSALPSGWTASPWTAGGGATVANGVVSVDAALLATDSTFGNNRVLEFVGTFAAGVASQHAGFGTDLNATPWAIVSTGNDGASLRARTDGPSGGDTTDLGATWLGAAHRYRIEWTATQVVYSIDGTVVATHAIAISQNMRPVVSDGAVGGGSLVVDWLRLGPYPASGTFLSRVYDSTNTVTTWTGLHWTANAPADTSLTISARAGNTPVPDATWSAFTTIAGPGAPISLAGRYLQYRVELATTNPQLTPVFRDVTAAYVAAVLPTVTTVSPSSGPISGGTAVTIDGTNFDTAATVTIGGTAATSVTVVNATRITATTPAHVPGAVDVVVTNPNGNAGTLANGFTYASVPTVTGLSPLSGTTAGGTSVTISGTSFTGATSVTFGGTAAPFTVVNATTITATTPARPAGAVDVIVTTPGGSSTPTTASQFTYAAPSMALQFNGSNQQVTVPNATSLQVATNITLEAWIKPTVSQGGHRHITGKNNYELSTERLGSGIQIIWEFATPSGWRSVSSGELTLNQWYHVAGTYGGGVTRLFVNGTQVAQANVTGNIVQTSNPFRIGSADGSGDLFAGIIDEVRLSSVVRYTANFTAPIGPFTPDANTRGLWHLDEGTGNTTTDASGNGNTGTRVNNPPWVLDSPFSGPPDTTGPVITTVAAGNLTATGATITWTTNELATSLITYGAGQQASDSTMVTSHTVPLTGLTPSTQYSYSVTSRDAAGNETTSSGHTFTTAADTTGPTVTMTAPATGATVAGTTVSVSASASDNVAVTSVQFLLDGQPLGQPDTTSPYTISWNSTTTSDGSHQLSARAVDGAGNSTTSTAVTVTVTNADTTPPTITNVQTSSVSATGAAISWTTNEASTSQVRYGLTTAYGSQTTLDTTLVTAHSQALSGLTANTLYHYQVVSRDAADNESVSADGTFTTAGTSGPSSAVQFNGTNQQISVPNATSLQVTSNITLEAWIKPTVVQSGHRHITGKNMYELSTEPLGAGIRIVWEFATGSGWRSISSGELALNQWYHVAGTYGGGTTRLFINGAQVASASQTGTIVQTSNPFRIGSADGSGDFFAGIIDEVRLSSVVRYTTNFAAPVAPFTTDANTRGLWHLDEGTGNTTADASGSGNTGTLVNGPIWVTDDPFN